MALTPRKVIIIGAGHVGSHAGYALASQALAERIVYIDTDIEKAKAQALDIFDATVYLPHHVDVKAGDYSDAKDADLMVIAPGPLPDMSKGQTRMDTLRDTIEIIKDVVVKIKESGFSGIILSISNPADVVAHYIQKKLDYPANKIISTSTTLDSARLRRAIAEHIGIDQKSIYAYALGEHGESQMVPWSTITIAGKPLLELMKEKPEKYGKLNLDAIAAEARAGGWKILGGKGSTEFGIGASIAEVTRAIFGDEKRILPVSVLLQGEYGQYDVYASVPAVLGINGVEEIIELNMTKEEWVAFNASCETLKENYEIALTL
ncbi:MAG: L-lactate dehydrogenase [Clostridiales bacterium]|uniref:L-lactate dehydrogenase n=1 Tax=Clostridium sp. N3C TaxID=1776758 RepID=UPI00092E13E0|nr:L-lactate dehydrogenase [Clostridium sp. N3C]NLZ48652.1 L-lactate dehydrogenase [Clostridiales bacterium]SCN21836.1 L-lactate dehydrogenase 2 [Clostridium sp. N3C]